MFKTNAQIIWDQMMRNLKEKEKNFTVEQVLGRLGRPTTTDDYGYTAKWDLPPTVNTHNTANALINAVTAATNPTLKTTNVETLKEIQRQIGANASALYTAVPNNLNGLIGLADAYNDAELRAVNTTNATLGWNAATQRESTVLYMNKKATKNGATANIESDLLSLQPGDKIMITDETVNVNVLKKQRQVWRVTAKPKSNPMYATIMDVPVTYAARPFNITSILRDNIANDAPLTVTLERFAQDEELD
jgi:hypothetical protein